MPLPPLKQRFAELIAIPSVSCTQPALDQSNRPVVELLGNWLVDLGFACELQPVSPGKFNLVSIRIDGECVRDELRCSHDRVLCLEHLLRRMPEWVRNISDGVRLPSDRP